MVAAVAIEGSSEPGELARSVVDAGSFPAFYDQALPRVYGYFLRRCGGVVADAEDLTQETFLAAAGELKRRGPVEAPAPWLFGIARHKLLDHYRRGNRAHGRLVPWHDALADANELTLPPLDPTGPEIQARLVAALARLPDGQRAAVVLHHLDGLPVPAVAAAVGKSPHAVESLLARGRATLRKLLADLHDTGDETTEIGHG
jgi:RNA polymerase sigma-70 factor (ECF subfamily)